MAIPQLERPFRRYETKPKRIRAVETLNLKQTQMRFFDEKYFPKETHSQGMAVNDIFFDLIY